MELVEIRDLDGPNLFTPVPAIKLEVIVDPDETVSADRLNRLARETGLNLPEDPVEALERLVAFLHLSRGLAPITTSSHELDRQGHRAVVYAWELRSAGRGIARAAFEMLTDAEPGPYVQQLQQAIANEYDSDEPEHPTWLKDSERSIPAIAVTGTNGKTTTTRLLAHIMSCAGYRVGWSSSSGVYINGEMVIEGDYSGHGGARRVLTDPDVDCGVLETARGGILLRGLGYESNDVGVFLNVSSDHLGLQGVNRLETLARVKATVVRATHPGGTVVLNAEDPLVLAQQEDVEAGVILTSQDSSNYAIQRHIASGERAVVVDNGVVTLLEGGDRAELIPVSKIPLTYGGAARHMVENTLAACAAMIGFGIDRDALISGMRTFMPDRRHNAGRLNVFHLDDVTVVVDFAHNESGLTHLTRFGACVKPESTRRTIIVGTAGDREDTVLQGLGRIAGEQADRVFIKLNEKYLRGRTSEEIVQLIEQGLESVDARDRLAGSFPSEFEAAFAAVDSANPGELILVMCVEDYEAVISELLDRGAREYSSVVT